MFSTDKEELLKLQFLHVSPNVYATAKDRKPSLSGDFHFCTETKSISFRKTPNYI